MAEETQGERGRHEAEERGRRQQRVDSRLDGHDQEIRALRTSLTGVSTKLGNVEDKVIDLTEAVKRREAVAQALAESAAKLVEKQLSVKNFYVGVGLVLASVIGLFLSAHA